MAINEILFEMAMPGYNQRQQQMDLNNLLTMAKATAPGSMERDEVNRAIMQHPSFRALQQRLDGASVEFDWTGERITPLQQKQLDIREKEADWRQAYYSQPRGRVFDFDDQLQTLERLETLLDTAELSEVDANKVKARRDAIFSNLFGEKTGREADVDKQVNWLQSTGKVDEEGLKFYRDLMMQYPTKPGEEIPTITTDEEYDALKPGQRFMFEGQMRIKN